MMWQITIGWENTPKILFKTIFVLNEKVKYTLQIVPLEIEIFY